MLLSALLISAFSAFFSLIYNCFGHGVYSFYMNCLFLPPLVGGAAVPLFLCGVCRLRNLPRLSVDFWFAAVSSVHAYFLLRGILEIAMASSPYLPVFLYAAGIASAAAVISAFAGRKKQTGKK